MRTPESWTIDTSAHYHVVRACELVNDYETHWADGRALDDRTLLLAMLHTDLAKVKLTRVQ